MTTLGNVVTSLVVILLTVLFVFIALMLVSP
jgi:hypothetical protein